MTGSKLRLCSCFPGRRQERGKETVQFKAATPRSPRRRTPPPCRGGQTQPQKSGRPASASECAGARARERSALSQQVESQGVCRRAEERRSGQKSAGLREVGKSWPRSAPAVSHRPTQASALAEQVTDTCARAHPSLHPVPSRGARTNGHSSAPPNDGCFCRSTKENGVILIRSHRCCRLGRCHFFTGQ